MKMNVMKLLIRDSQSGGWPLVLMAGISGVANGSILAIIDSAAENASLLAGNTRNLLLFVIAMAIFMVAKRSALLQASTSVEKIIHRVRIRVLNKVRQTELSLLEAIVKAEIITRLNQDANYISQTAMIILNAFQSAIMVTFCLVYVGWISWLALAMTLTAIIGGGLIYWSNQAMILQIVDQAAAREIKFFDILNHILDGFKELKVNKERSRDLYVTAKETSEILQKLRIKVNIQFVFNFLFSQFFLYILIAAIVFFMPMVDSGYSAVVLKLAAAILFIIGPLEALLSSISIVIRANNAAQKLWDLEYKLERMAEPESHVRKRKLDKIEFERQLTLQDMTFSYVDPAMKPLFSIGPISFSVNKGELVFLTGGNGSGKSTILKLIAGLYHPVYGHLRVDDQIVDTPHYPLYRDMLSVVFSDFHLFDRLYGLYNVDEDRVRDLLRKMRLEDKTDFIEDRFTNLDLSSGQRRRIGLIVALLEDRPLLLLDEVAADQDPEFRRYFYEVFLKELQASGKTIIAVTHDDRYFHVADRIVKLEYGHLVDGPALKRGKE